MRHHVGAIWLGLAQRGHAREPRLPHPAVAQVQDAASFEFSSGYGCAERDPPSTGEPANGGASPRAVDAGDKLTCRPPSAAMRRFDSARGDLQFPNSEEPHRS
jgi:hypothetical protein